MTNTSIIKMQQLVRHLLFVFLPLACYKLFSIFVRHFRDDVPLDRPISVDDIDSVDNFGVVFSELATKFDSLYAELFMVTHGNKLNYTYDQLASVISHWQTKIDLINSIVVSKAWYRICDRNFSSNYFDNSKKFSFDQMISFLKEWFAYLVSSGLTMGPSDQDIVKDKTFHYYYDLDAVYRIDDIFYVVKPFWLFRGRCVEKGIATKSKK